MNRGLILIIELVTISALLYGCSSEKSQKVLSFFFDGVTPQGETEGKDASGARREAGKPSKVERYEHGPFAAKQCEACHVRGSNNLKLPVSQLCFTCHTIEIKKKHLHGPVAAGGCTICHDPHGSGKRYLLVSDPKDFCLYCHDKNDLEKREVHREAKEQCTVCHDAHSSDNDFLLKDTWKGRSSQ